MSPEEAREEAEARVGDSVGAAWGPLDLTWWGTEQRHTTCLTDACFPAVARAMQSRGPRGDLVTVGQGSGGGYPWGTGEKSSGSNDQRWKVDALDRATSVCLQSTAQGKERTPPFCSSPSFALWWFPCLHLGHEEASRFGSMGRRSLMSGPTCSSPPGAAPVSQRQLVLPAWQMLPAAPPSW